MPVEDNEMDPVAWWAARAVPHCMPHLSLLARYLLCIPATSSSVERDFSTTGYIVSERRTRLKAGLVSDILVLHGNEDLLSKSLAPL
jgi:hypothetical protein